MKLNNLELTTFTFISNLITIHKEAHTDLQGLSSIYTHYNVIVQKTDQPMPA